MSIKNNRDLMVEQIKRLKGQLNENKSLGDVIKVAKPIYDDLVKKTMSKLKKDIESSLNSKLKGKVLDGLTSGYRRISVTSPIKTVRAKIYTYGVNNSSELLVSLRFTHEDGTTSTFEDYSQFKGYD